MIPLPEVRAFITRQIPRLTLTYPDFDPEEEASGSTSDSDADTEDENVQRRQHYIAVRCVDILTGAFRANASNSGSKLRKREPIELGPQYAGSSVRRQDLLDETNESNGSYDDPFGLTSNRRSDGSDHKDGHNTEDEIVDPDQVADLDLSTPEIDDEDEIDSDDAFEDGDDERFKNFSFKDGQGSRVSPTKHQNRLGTRSLEGNDASTTSRDSDASPEPFGTYGDAPSPSSDDEESSGSDSGGDRSSSSDTSEPPVPPKAAATDRAALRKLMASDQKSVVASLSRETAADIAKGKAVAQQQQTFSVLLNCRIRLQKALTLTRDLKDLSSLSEDAIKDSAAVIESAQLASLNLWNSLNSLRASLHKDDSPSSKVQEAAEAATISTPRSDLLSRMQTFETLSIPTHRATLAKWSARTAAPSTLPSRNKFSNSSSQLPFLSVLDSHLSDSNMTTQLSKSYMTTDASNFLSKTYDDTSFYKALLRDLVAQKASSASFTNPSLLQSQNLPLSNTLPKPAKQHRANLDTKASKGRKMRYTVHEKLQNFMPREDRRTWGERQIAELFGGLLGRKIHGGLDEGEEDDKLAREGEVESESHSEVDNGHAGGLRLFGNSAAV